MEKQFSPLAASRFIVGRGSISYLKELGKKRAAVIYDGRILTPPAAGSDRLPDPLRRRRVPLRLRHPQRALLQRH